MKELTVIDEGGQELQSSDMADGQYVPPEMNDYACLVSAYRLLKEIARKDTDAHYRAAASKQAEGLKAMIKRKNKGRDLTDLDVFGPEPTGLPGPRALPRGAQPLTIDMETK